MGTPRNTATMAGEIYIRDQTGGVEAQLRAGVEAAPGAWLIVDGADRVIFANDRFRALWEIDADAVPTSGTAARALAAARIDESRGDSLAQFESGPEPRTFILDDLRMIVGRQWQAGTGADAIRIWQFHEATETDLRDAERLNDFSDLASDYFWETDADWRYTYISEPYEAITGVPVAELLSKTREEIWAVHGVLDSDAIARALERAAGHIERREA